MKRFLFISTLVSIAIVSCKKKNDKTDDYDNSSSPTSNAIIERSFDEMTNISDQAVSGNLVYYKMDQVTVLYGKESASNLEKAACNVIITIDTTSSPKSVTVDWGNTNCDCNDGKQRRGKIITTFTGQYRDPGTVITHTPVGYYVNNHHIEGTKTVTNMGNNGSGQPYFNVEVDGTVTLSSGEVFNYTSTRVRTWTNGFSTIGNFYDDEYDITGSAQASSTSGNGYTASVTNPLHIKIGCPYIVSGTLNFTPTGKPVRVIDYGSGNCDATFTVTVNGTTYTING